MLFHLLVIRFLFHRKKEKSPGRSTGAFLRFFQFKKGYLIFTAVPYARISAAPCMTEEVA